MTAIYKKLIAQMPITLFLLIAVVPISNPTWAQEPTQQRPSAQRNQASQRYEVNQTYGGQTFLKDNNIWVYNKEFADLFGMPAQYIEDVQGVVAAAFRIEDTSYQRCGFGGNASACQKIEQCLIDLYFDESKNPLPWATDIKSQWLPWYSSMRWLRPLQPSEKPYGMEALDTPPDVVRNSILSSPVVAFSDPVSHRQAIFTTNARSKGDEEAISGSMAVIGYSRDFYKALTVVNLQLSCMRTRDSINIRLDAKKDVFDTPIARFNKIFLPTNFVSRINGLLKINSERDEAFNRSLFPPPLGTKGLPKPTSAPTQQ